MKKLYIVNTAVFTSVAALHVLRLVFNAPAFVGDFEIQMWLSAVAVVGIAILAWLNWRQVKQHSQDDWLTLLIALILVDAFIVFYSWVAQITAWGISGDTWLWFVLMDLVLVGIVHGAVKKGSGKRKR